MRLWVLLDQCLPSDEVNTMQVVRTVEALTRINPDTQLFIPSAEAPPAVPQTLKDIAHYYGTTTPLNIHAVPTHVGQVAKVRLEKLVHPWRVRHWINGTRPDLIYTRNFPAAILGLSHGIPVVYETYRLLAGGFAALKPLVRTFGAQKNVKAVVTHSEHAARDWAQAGFPAAKLHSIHNGFDPTELQPVLDRDQARRQLGIDDARPWIVYTGHVQPHKGIETLLDLAALTPEIQYQLIGTDAASAPYLELARARHLTNCHFRPWMKTDAIVPWLYAADLTIISPSSRPLKMGRTVLPIKVFTYLATGRPIVAPDLPDIDGLLQPEKNVLLVPPDAPDRAAAAIRDLLADPQRLANIAAGALETASHLTWDARAQKLFDLFQTAVA